MPLDAMCRENFGGFYRRKFKKITNEAIKAVKKTHLLGIFKFEAQTFNSDNDTNTRQNTI